MGEKNNTLTSNLLWSKFNWWNRFWKQRIKIVKVESKDSSYQEYLDSIRKGVVKKNNGEGSKEDPAYQVYLDIVKDYLSANNIRLLTEKEEEIVIVHLKAAALTYCNTHYNRNLLLYPENQDIPYAGLGITQVLSIETAKKVSEILPDIPTPTSEQVDQRIEEVLAIRNFLYEG